MQETNIYSRIESLDSLKQERLFLFQKYRNDFILWEQNIFELFWSFQKDEKKMKQFLHKIYLKEFTFEYNGKQEHLDFFQKNKLTSKLKEIWDQTKIYTTLVLKDILRYFELETQIHRTQEENTELSWEQKKIGEVANYYSKEIMSALRDKKRKEKNTSTYSLNWEIDNDLLELLWLNKKDIKEPNEAIQKLAWKYDFFKLVQKSVEKGYIFTHKELAMIQDVLWDVQSGKVVLFTGDTGSGKTELARFICKEFLKTEYVFVSGSRDAEVSDFTLEKTVTSRSRFNQDTDIVDGSISQKTEAIDTEATKVLNEITWSESFKKLVLQKAQEKGSREEDLEVLKKDLENISLTQKNLVTEYHLMWIYKAAKLGIPCIIDEVNIIRPEVFMALNDLLTRKVWDDIQLPNALGNIKVQSWFCIILTWNDPEQNSQSKNYTSGRYNFDEASYNRLRVYAKNYLTQIIQTHRENKLEELDKTYEYLNENELYGVILMMMFESASDIISTGKYGFEVMKRDFEWNHISQSEFFTHMKQFVQAIATIQKAFAGETIILDGKNSSLSLKDMIKRKVFSMRNLVEVLASYQKDSLPLEYHIYHEFIKHTTNTDELYALAVIFHRFWFFGDLVTDNKEATLKNLDKKNSQWNLSIWTITLWDIEHKFVVTKQHLYKEYFWSMEIGDDFFKERVSQIDNEKSEQGDIQNEFHIQNQIEITDDDLLEIIENIWNKLNEKNSEIDFWIFYNLTNIMNILQNQIQAWKIEKSKYSFLNASFRDMYNILDRLWADSNTDIQWELSHIYTQLVDFSNK